MLNGAATPMIFESDGESPPDERSGWSRSLAEAVRDPDELIALLNLPAELLDAARQLAQGFPLLVPRSYLARMNSGDPCDPLLQQVLPVAAENLAPPGFVVDAVSDANSRKAPGLLHKYSGRALLIATGTCAIHCRYCFRRHYPYGQEPRRLDDWQPALDAIASDSSLQEIILSGGDPLLLTDARLETLIARLDAVPHLKRLRIHTRLPIVLPDRVTTRLIDMLRDARMTAIVVVHANHPRELQADCGVALRTLVRSGLTVLNQSVLLRGINDNADVLTQLSEQLTNLGVIPYYLHQLDRVLGTAHFEVSIEEGRRLMTELRRRLPGYAVPQYVFEEAGAESKIPLI